MRDLSIRGAGNLLGKSQSGFIDSVGFELYSQLLEEAIAKRNGNANANTRTKGNAELILQIDAYLPDTYISDQRHKIEIYKKIRQIDNRVNYEELQERVDGPLWRIPRRCSLPFRNWFSQVILGQGLCSTCGKKR